MECRAGWLPHVTTGEARPDHSLGRRLTAVVTGLALMAASGLAGLGFRAACHAESYSPGDHPFCIALYLGAGMGVALSALAVYQGLRASTFAWGTALLAAVLVTATMWGLLASGVIDSFPHSE